MIESSYHRIKRENPQKIKEYERTYYEKNKEKHKQRTLRWKEKNLDRWQIFYKTYREEHKEKHNAYKRQWNKDNLEKVRLYTRLAKQKRREREQCNDPVNKRIYTQILLDDVCCYCGKGVEHIDHIIPVVAGGSGDWDNLTGACSSCNTKKSAKPLLQFLLERS